MSAMVEVQFTEQGRSTVGSLHIMRLVSGWSLKPMEPLWLSRQLPWPRFSEPDWLILDETPRVSAPPCHCPPPHYPMALLLFVPESRPALRASQRGEWGEWGAAQEGHLAEFLGQRALKCRQLVVGAFT